MPVAESDLIAPTLAILNDAPDGFVTTSDLVASLEERFRPKGKDAQIIDTRQDSHFSQKVRNLVSHRNDSNGIEKRGLVTYDKARKGFTITFIGRSHARKGTKF